MPTNLNRHKAKSKSGDELFIFEGKPTEDTLLAFWQWSESDLLSNATRGKLAEFIVANALDCPLIGVRSEWDAYDLQTQDGIRLEVKSAAYLQSWHQEKYSQIRFNIPNTIAWSPDTGLYASESARQADVYVFALLNHKDKSTVNPLNLDQWEFYLLPTKVINEKIPQQKSISLSRLQQLSGKSILYGDLRQVFSQLDL